MEIVSHNSPLPAVNYFAKKRRDAGGRGRRVDGNTEGVQGGEGVLAVAVTPLLYTYEMDVGARGGNKMDGK